MPLLLNRWEMNMVGEEQEYCAILLFPKSTLNFYHNIVIGVIVGVMLDASLLTSINIMISISLIIYVNNAFME